MDSPDDRSVLIELFLATNGPSWYNNDGWNTSASISTWHGVTVDEAGRVVMLDLGINYLEGEVSTAVVRDHNRCFVKFLCDGLALASIIFWVMG